MHPYSTAGVGEARLAAMRPLAARWPFHPADNSIAIESTVTELADMVDQSRHISEIYSESEEGE